MHPGIVWCTEHCCVHFDIGFNPARSSHCLEPQVSEFLHGTDSAPPEIKAFNALFGRHHEKKTVSHAASLLRFDEKESAYLSHLHRLVNY